MAAAAGVAFIELVDLDNVGRLIEELDGGACAGRPLRVQRVDRCIDATRARRSLAYRSPRPLSPPLALMRAADPEARLGRAVHAAKPDLRVKRRARAGPGVPPSQAPGSWLTTGG